MNWYKVSNDFEDMFGISLPGKVSQIDEPREERVSINLYRSLVSEDISQLQRQDNQYVLDPSTSEQGLLWFSHDLLRDGMNYVVDRGRHILTYPLECVKHIQTVHYEDGSSYDKVPQEIDAKTNPTSNSPIFAGYELPDGWLFSYKVEKFIVCDHSIVVDPGMIQSNELFKEQHELV